MLKDPSDLSMPVEFADEEDVCDHGQWKNECNLCRDERYADDHIDELKEGDKL